MSDDDARKLVMVVETIWNNMQTNYNAFRHCREMDAAREMLAELKTSLEIAGDADGAG